MPIKVMVNGLPGKMATAIAGAVIDDNRFELVPYSFGGWSRWTGQMINGKYVKVIHPAYRNAKLLQIKGEVGNFIVIDFTRPDAAVENAKLYCEHQLPFVMGTTGVDTQQLHHLVNASSISAVIAPNMAKPIVALQAMLQYAANSFPHLFADYYLAIRESHQAGKVDTSGTARDIVARFNELGVSLTNIQTEVVTEPTRQLQLGIPEEHLGGHAWHTYTLRSLNYDIALGFTHNVNGREVYVEGTLDAILFLEKMRQQGVRGRVFSMIDVLGG